MKIYLAAPFGERFTMRRVRTYLQSIGHVVTSRWLNCEERPEPGSDQEWPEFARRMAAIDLEDLAAAETLIIFTGKSGTRGGMHVEFGYALALRKRICIVGERVNVFHFRPEIEVVKNLWDVTGISVPVEVLGE